MLLAVMMELVDTHGPWLLVLAGLQAAGANLALRATTALAVLLGLYHGYWNERARKLEVNVNFTYARNDGDCDREHSGRDQRAKGIDGAKWKASEVAQRSDSEGGNSIACLIKRDYSPRRRGRESWKRLPAEIQQ